MSLFAKRHGADDKEPPIAIITKPAVAPVPLLVKRQTTKYGTKYERARLLGERATQISLGAELTIDIMKIPEKERSRYTDPLVIAQKELTDKTMPLGVRRYLPDRTHEDWFLDELIFDYHGI